MKIVRMYPADGWAVELAAAPGKRANAPLVAWGVGESGDVVGLIAVVGEATLVPASDAGTSFKSYIWDPAAHEGDEPDTDQPRGSW